MSARQEAYVFMQTVPGDTHETVLYRPLNPTFQQSNRFNWDRCSHWRQ